MGYPKFGFIELLVQTLAIRQLASLFPDEYRVLVSALIEARQRSGKTQADLAAELGRPQSFVSKVENVERLLDVAEYVKIMDLVGGNAIDAISEITNGSTRGRMKN